ncbi:aminopeptidase P family protein [Candidatus Peregrinibacteria bacterium]|nr:M24 family metallopeptidase [Candidatus Peregrinibacteria bacterium]MBI3816419.1 aminopeptidase P family protein [Candidatus Peregrinibacteria bacterium]
MRPSSPHILLRRADVPAFLVSDLTNIRYLSGIAVSAGLMLVTQRRFILFVDARYRLEAEQRCERGVMIRDVSAVAKMLQEFPECGFESDRTTVEQVRSWKRQFPSTKFIQKIEVLEHFRRGKSEEEVRLLRRAQKVTRELLRRVPLALRRAVTEEKLARQLQIWALELGADGLSFDPIVAFGTHTSIPHHRPTARSLQKGHIVQIDVGAKVGGYCGDMSEVFFTAQPTPQQAKVYQIVCEAQKDAMRSVRAGVTNHELDRIAREVLTREGIEHAFTHALGHGVGLEIHEGVSLSPKAPETKLLKNEVITIEPGVYFPGKFGMRVEEMVFVE